ncbi:heavy metal translocating P-type ATPase [Legionella shakespearei]|uniref:Heavy metal transporting P-type ATPase n=1 Tax=Legionella shakespearei DSM 23087 TaxID=1122169 RepID=A0A0W0YWV9_9GAMM|nr:HAD-IC family P-type ATPase [Legionella shakespearei]KTD61336.1 heavy metal transporting P-type ATPase [Legionella shakespearei DSM 23087]
MDHAHNHIDHSDDALIEDQYEHSHDSDHSTHKKHKKKKKHEHAHGDHNHDHHHDHEHENHWLKAGLGILWGVGLLVLSIASFNIPAIAYYAITGLTSLMTLYLGYSVYQSAWDALLGLRWNTTTLYTISTLTIFAVSLVSMFVPGLPMMFEAAPLVLGFWHLGEGIEHSLVGEITKKLDVRDCLSPTVKMKGSSDKEISIKKLLPGDHIIVNQGDVIPVDGVLAESTLLYTTRIDGSPALKRFKAGDAVKSGMRLAEHGSPVEMQVTHTYKKSYLSLIAQNINKANDEKAPIQLFADTILKYFIPGLLAIAVLSGIIIGTLFTPALAIQCVISVLVSACPCALSLITPMAVKIGMTKASDHGIHFNNGKALQAAADIDVVVFDLNGTLTKGQIEVSSLNIDDKRFLNHIALLESHSEHPVAKTIRAYIQGSTPSAKEELQCTSIDKSHHSGMKGIINGVRFMIGNREMLLENDITQFPKPYDNPDNGSVYIVRGSRVIGQIALDDPLRADAVATVNKLKELGKEVHICSGAGKTTVEKYAEVLGISRDNLCANAVGAVTKAGEMSKTSYLELLKLKGHRVAMVGDAANDLTAIAYADLGIAVKSTIGDNITEQYAGIVIQEGSLFPIATAFDVSQKTQQNIFQNLIVSLTYNSVITLVAAGLFVALGFALNPVLGVALMVIESTIVLANLYRFKQQDVLTPEPENHDEINEELNQSTSTILNTLGHQPESAKQFVTISEPQSSGSVLQFNPPSVQEQNSDLDTNDTPLCSACR